MVSLDTSPWYKQATRTQWKTLIVASLGWMLDSMDIMLYSMVLVYLMSALGMSTSTAGLLSSLTLIASAVGGVVFGLLADRLGRTKALIASVLVYSVFTGACGLAQSVTQLALFRVLPGFGMGGEWATGAALVAETWPQRHRGKALGLMQSSWAIGYAAAITAVVLPCFGWRAVFFAGFLPALMTLWIRHDIDEPEIWKHQQRYEKARLGELFNSTYAKHTAITSIMNAGTLFAYWGLFSWIPAYLGLPVERGGAGLSVITTSKWVILMQAGAWFGYVAFGVISDKLGRKATYIGYILVAAALVPIYGRTRDPTFLLMLGPLLGFLAPDIFPASGRSAPSCSRLESAPQTKDSLIISVGALARSPLIRLVRWPKRMVWEYLFTLSRRLSSLPPLLRWPCPRRKEKSSNKFPIRHLSWPAMNYEFVR